ncbi:hypothetical protein [Micromonospora sp. SH-82]|uniref:hypothetical protein n=1 Tax=Micromonospora sp. SH-82 TaxID=3132938 RepID=UPI003EBC8886
MSELSQPDRVTIAHTCQDWAATYNGGPLHLTRHDAVRYLADGHLDALTARHGRDTIWQAVAAYLDAHPDTLTAPRTTQAQRAHRQAERDTRAAAHLAAAKDHHLRNLPYEALGLIDRAELASPTYRDFDRYRQYVHRKVPPFTPADLTATPHRYRTPLPLHSPVPGPPVVHHGAADELWVYPGRPVVNGPWPAATPEQCTTPDDTTWLAAGTVLVCTGCGLDVT